MNNGTRRDHFGIEECLATQFAMKIAAVAIGPIQHRSNGKTALAERHCRRKISGVLGHYSQNFSQFESNTVNCVTAGITQVYRELALILPTSSIEAVSRLSRTINARAQHTLACNVGTCFFSATKILLAPITAVADFTCVKFLLHM